MLLITFCAVQYLWKVMVAFVICSIAEKSCYTKCVQYMWSTKGKWSLYFLNFISQQIPDSASYMFGSSECEKYRYKRECRETDHFL